LKLGDGKLSTFVHTLPDDVSDFEKCIQKEWLVTNGIGGFAAGTVGGANTRRYHGLLIASLNPPVERFLMLSKIEEQVIYKGELFHLSCNEYVDGTVAPHGYRLISGFYLDGLIPVWRYSLGDAVLEKKIWMEHGQNTTFIKYELLCGSSPAELTLLPLCAYRDFHWHQHEKDNLRFDANKSSLTIHLVGHEVAYSLNVDKGTFHANPHWHWNLKHRVETARGLDEREDLYCPGSFSLRLNPGEYCQACCTTGDEIPSVSAGALSREKRRQEKLVPSTIESIPEWIRTLHLAADSFLVQRNVPNKVEKGVSIIAGYPWFSDWTRDTMISLTGICLVTGRYSSAADILTTYAEFVDNGMLPNRFADDGKAAEYNSVDGALWYFVAIYRYYQVTGDTALLDTLYSALKEIVENYYSGTRYGIGVNKENSLLYSGEAGVQLTWMDAKIDDWVVTPRSGAAVEINALWFNALSIIAEVATLVGAKAEAKKYKIWAENSKIAFEKHFWFEKGEYLYDVVFVRREEAHESLNDSSLRPNQLLAISLPFEPLSNERSRKVFEVCASHLYTPLGLRTLASRDSKYRGEYGGGQLERDSSYHQGTVWPWLTGYFVAAHLKLYKNPTQAFEYVKGFEGHLAEAGLGSVSEIFSGNAPHRAEGCFAQAWSVAEILRAWKLCQGDERFF